MTYWTRSPWSSWTLSSGSFLRPALRSGLGQFRVHPGWLAVLHLFDEVDVDLPAWWPVMKCDRQWHAEEELTVVGCEELCDFVVCDRGVELAVFESQADVESVATHADDAVFAHTELVWDAPIVCWLCRRHR